MPPTAPSTAGPPLRHVASGKVRDVYEPDDDSGSADVLVMVASDRISAYDHVLPTLIPDKGRILTALSLWWFERLADLVPHHLVDVSWPGMPAQWQGRTMVVRRLDMVSIECVARGYLAGSALADVREHGTLGELPLPSGLGQGARLPEPVFTPATKAAVGDHDENISYAEVVRRLGPTAAAELRRLTLAIYERGAALAGERGIVLADTKLEFGYDRAGTLVLADEVLTPDSSRFWPAELWSPGASQPSFDKQYVRDWLTSPDSGWDPGSEDEPPPLPAEVVERTRDRYVEAYERLTGHRFS